MQPVVPVTLQTLETDTRTIKRMVLNIAKNYWGDTNKIYG
jgi:hypothetical protein